MHLHQLYLSVDAAIWLVHVRFWLFECPPRPLFSLGWFPEIGDECFEISIKRPKHRCVNRYVMWDGSQIWHWSNLWHSGQSCLRGGIRFRCDRVSPTRPRWGCPGSPPMIGFVICSRSVAWRECALGAGRSFRLPPFKISSSFRIIKSHLASNFFSSLVIIWA